MESFIYADMNRACRQKDQSKIRFYGAFAAALSFIIYFANAKNNSSGDSSGKIKLYRGLKMFPEEVEGYTVGSYITLPGYTSTSKSAEKAL